MASYVRKLKPAKICFFLGTIVFFIFTKIIFERVYKTTKMLVDEEFHLPLGLSYCNHEFDKWDEKVTTLPGLYLFSSILLLPFGVCSVYSLRFVSLGASILNIFLFYLLFSLHEKSDWMNVLSSFTLALLPPLYFFSHVYYTDILSISMIMAMVYLSEKEYHWAASCFAFWSVLCRQTNVIWVAFVAGRFILTELYRVAMEKYFYPEPTPHIPAKHIYHFLMRLVRSPVTIVLNISMEFVLQFSTYLAALLTFLGFIIINGSVVVGDKNAHEATLHLPQMFYFSVFCLVFAWPYFLGEVIDFLIYASKHKLLILCCIIVALLMVHFNTLTHPYILADNRHYTFYLWNRFYGNYPWFRYVMVPVYVFAWYVILKMMIDRNDIRFFALGVPATIIVLISQKLIDVRYYFVPYLLFRLRIKNTANTVFNVILECVTYCVINAITFNIFFNRTIWWDNYNTPQRIMW